MRRRDFIGAAGLWPLAAAAQQDVPVQASVIRILREQAETAAARISQFISEIERQIGLTTTTPWAAAPIAQRRFGYGRLLRRCRRSPSSCSSIPAERNCYVSRDGPWA